LPRKSDLDLAESAARGNQTAMEALVERALPVVRGFARRLTGDPEEGDALTQEAMVAALEKLERYRGNAAFSTWVCGIALRKAADWQREKAAQINAQAKMESAPQIGPEEALIKKDAATCLWRLAAQLPEVYREAVIARATSENTEQAADQLGLTANALRVRLHRARLALRELMKKQYPDWYGEMKYAKE
jgi:RNA polymerase sigma-70 factor, ECF subfamily